MPRSVSARRGFSSSEPQPRVLEDQVIITNVSAPTFVNPGNTVTIEVEVQGKAPIGTDAEAVIRFTRGDTGEVIRRPPSGVMNIGSGQKVTETFSFIMPERNVPIDIEALERDSPGGLRPTDQHTQIINSAGGVPSGVLNATEFVPWAVGGSAVGYGASRVYDQVDTMPGVVAGAGVGLGAKLAADQIRVPQLQFPTVPVAVTGVALIGGALLLSRVTDVAELAR